MAYFPIELQGDANLTLVVDGTFTVTGGAGRNGTAVTSPAVAASKGYAGISVPYGTSLVVLGSGTLTAQGGPAGDGGNATIGTNAGGGGGGGAGAGIGGNGGDGGMLNSGHGNNGVSAGTISVYESVTLRAYGGVGGAGGFSDYTGASSDPGSGGGGGYPGAGIGGGGAGGGGGDAGSGAGGFSGGQAEVVSAYPIPFRQAIDGLAHPEAQFFQGKWSMNPGNGYYQAGASDEVAYRLIGGGSAHCYIANSGNSIISGHGGSAGSGGTVKIGNLVTLNVSNGSYRTANKALWNVEPAPIYLQSGFKLDMIRSKDITSVSARTGEALTQELKSKNVTQSVEPFTYNDKEIYGVGSGAGYTEVSNGTEICHLMRGQWIVPPG